jgi:hypothetical protein
VTVLQGETFIDPGATATDSEDGDLTDAIVVSGDIVDTSTVGTYTISYDVIDSEGLPALTVTRTVIVSESVSTPFTLTFATATADQLTLVPDSPLTFTADITNTGEAGTGVVNLEVYSNGIQVHQEIFEDQAFTDNETRQFQTTFTPAQAGTYSLQVGLYEQFWAGFFDWTSDAAVARAEAQETSSVIIYDDAFGASIGNWSWDTAIDASSEAVAPYQGSTSLMVSFEQPWAGLYLNTGSLTTSDLTFLTFAIHGGPTGGQILQVGALDDTNTLTGQVRLDAYLSTDIPVDDWVFVSIPLSDLNASDTSVQGIIIQGASGAIEPSFYIDDIVLE